MTDPDLVAAHALFARAAEAAAARAADPATRAARVQDGFDDTRKAALFAALAEDVAALAAQMEDQQS